MTKERAKAIIQNAKNKAQEKNKLWTEQLDLVMDLEEMREVYRLWLTMPSNTKFSDALIRMADF